MNVNASYKAWLLCCNEREQWIFVEWFYCDSRSSWLKSYLFWTLYLYWLLDNHDVFYIFSESILSRSKTSEAESLSPSSFYTSIERNSPRSFSRNEKISVISQFIHAAAIHQWTSCDRTANTSNICKWSGPSTLITDSRAWVVRDQQRIWV